MLANIEQSVVLEKPYSTLTKTECVFAALWHNPDGIISTESIAQYYEVLPQQILDILNVHHQEIGILEDDWTPRAAIRLGMLLNNSPMATNVRSQAIDVIEAHNQPSKKAAVKFLLENAQFVEWSNREISRILECCHKTVGKAREELESQGKILPFKKRKHVRNGSIVERENKGSHSVHGDSPHEEPSNIDSTVINAFVHGDSPHEEPSNIDSVVQRKTVPRTYTENELSSAIDRAIAESKIGFKLELEEIAQAQVAEQLAASQSIARAKALEVAQLQQRIEELESLQILEVKNQELQQRIEELERALENRPAQEWRNTFTKQAEKVINDRVMKAILALEPELHLRSLACSPPPIHLFSQVSQMLEKVRYFLDRVPLSGRRLRCNSLSVQRYGTLVEVIENDAVIDWDFALESDTPDDIYNLQDIEILPTIEGIAEGSNVSWFDPSKPAYSYHGIIQEIHPQTNEASVFWQEMNKVKREPIAGLRLIRLSDNMATNHA